MPLFFLFFLFLVGTLSAAEGKSESTGIPFADTDAETSSIVGGCINALTGTYVAPRSDWTLLSSEPLSLMRMYTHKNYFLTGLHSCWRHNFHSLGCFYYRKLNRNGIKPICEARSTFISPSGSSSSFETIHRGHKLPKKVDTAFAFKHCGRGLTNIGTGIISGQTNVKSSHCELDLSSEVFKAITGTGHQHIFQKIDYEKHDMPASILYGDECYKFLIQKEIKPNGNCVQYAYDSDRNLVEVQSTNASGSLLFGSFKFEHASRKELKNDPQLTITGNDGRKISYEFERFHLHEPLGHKQFFVTSVTRPEAPKESYKYVKSDDKSFCLLSRIEHPDGRYLGMEYYTEGKDTILDKVKSIKAPVGPGGSEETLYHFFYHLSKNKEEIGSTEVIDAYGHKTIYRYNWEPRLHAIEHYTGKAHYSLYSKENYYWGDNEDKNCGNLLSKTFEDRDGKILRCQSFVYDKRGNPIEEQLWGNLTGQGSKRIVMEGNYPKINGAESYKIFREYSKDGFNLLLKEIEPNEKITEYAYKPDSNLLIAKWTKAPGIHLREFFSYDENAILVKKIEDDGIRKSEDDLFQVNQRLITYISPNLTGGGIGLPKEIRECYWDPSSQSEKQLKRTIIRYDAYGHPIKKRIFDANDSLQLETCCDYDSQGNVIKEWNNKDQTFLHSYDANKNCIYSKDLQTGVETHKSYDLANRCICIEETHPTEKKGIHTTEKFCKTFTYDFLGRLDSSTDIFGNETTHAYNGFGKLIKTRYPSIADLNGNPTSIVETFAYDLFGNKCSLTDANGETTNYKYTIRGTPTHIHYPDGTQESFEYTLEGHLAKKVEKNGTVVLFTYDALGRKRTEEKYDKSTLLSKEEWVYNSSQLISHIDPNGNITLYTYDGAGRKVSERKEDTLTTFEYDDSGRLHKTLHHLENDAFVSINEYDDLDQLIEERTENSNGKLFSKNRYEYDLAGNCTDTISYQQEAIPLLTKTEYDSHRNPVKTTDPLGNVTHFRYQYNHVDSNGNRVLQKIIVDANGIQTIETHDVRGKVDSIVKLNPFGALLSKERICYDPNGNAIYWIESVVENAAEKRTVINHKEFGPGNRLECVIEAVGTPEQKKTSYFYNEFGQLESLIKPDGTQLLSSYDALGRLKRYTSSDQTIDYIYTYDANHNLVSVKDRCSQTMTHRQYDAFNRVIKETLGNGLSFSYAYDALGRKTAVQLPDGSSIGYAYEGANLKNVIRLDQNNNEKYRHCYQNHDLYGEATTIQLAKGTGQETRQYDPLGRRIATQSKGWEEVVPSKGYDPVGNLLKVHVKDEKGVVQEQYGYDDLNQLTLEEGSYSHKFQYDSLNNCLEKDGLFRQHNALNQVLSDSQNEYQYHPNGNLIQIKGQETLDFQYDAQDRLISVVKGNTKVCYTYDHFHRRLKKELFVGGISQQVQLFLYVDQDEIGSVENGKITELRILGEGHGAEIGSAIAIELVDRTLVPLHNMRGDLCRLIDADTKEIVQSCHYSAFGEQSTESLIPWGFSSKRLDPETGFIYFGRRYYSPSLGRWITPDPLGLKEGPNLYAYVHNSPLTHFDLYGLASQDFSSFYSTLSSTLNGFRPYSPKDSIYSQNNYTSAWRNYSSKIATGYLDPIGTVGGYTNSLWNYNYRGSSYSQMWSDFKLNVLSFDRICECSGVFFNAIPMARAVQSGVRVISSINLSKNLIANTTNQIAKRVIKTETKKQFSRYATKQVANGVKATRNRMFPDPAAKGEHTVFRRNPETNKITHYETFRPQSNPRNPNAWESVKRFDGIGKSHQNKILAKDFETPHIHDPNCSGGIRYPEMWEIPKL